MLEGEAVRVQVIQAGAPFGQQAFGLADHFGRAADLLLQGATARAHNGFKIELARRAVVRTLMQATNATPQSQADKKIA